MSQDNFNLKEFNARVKAALLAGPGKVDADELGALRTLLQAPGAHPEQLIDILACGIAGRFLEALEEALPSALDSQTLEQLTNDAQIKAFVAKRAKAERIEREAQQAAIVARLAEYLDLDQD